MEYEKGIWVLKEKKNKPKYGDPTKVLHDRLYKLFNSTNRISNKYSKKSKIQIFIGCYIKKLKQ